MFTVDHENPVIINNTPITISFVIFSFKIQTENIKLKISKTPSAIGVTNEELYFSNK